MTSATSFRVGLVQMRSARTPAENFDAAAALIREARQAGAEYVLTPEMTNAMESKRERLLAAIGAEEGDASVVGFRALARELKLHLHIGSLALRVGPDRAANRALLIDP